MANVKINGVDYDALYKTGADIRSYVCGADSLTGCLEKIYEQILLLEQNGVWKGESYNELKKIFIDNKPMIQNQLQYFRNAVPRTLQRIANRYSIADREEKLTVISIEGKADLDLDMPSAGVNSSGSNNYEMVFDQSSVNSTLNTLTLYFGNAEDQLKKVKSLVDGLKGSWDDDVSEHYFTEFNANYTNISTTIENLKTECKRIIETAMKNMESAETANMAKTASASNE